MSNPVMLFIVSVLPAICEGQIRTMRETSGLTYSSRTSRCHGPRSKVKAPLLLLDSRLRRRRLNAHSEGLILSGGVNRSFALRRNAFSGFTLRQDVLDSDGFEIIENLVFRRVRHVGSFDHAPDGQITVRQHEENLVGR